MYRACRGAVSLGGSAVRFGDPSLVPSCPSRSAARSIFLVSTDGRRYAVFVSSFSCVIRWRRGGSFFLSSRPSSRSSRLVWRLVSILCGSPVVSSGSSIRRRLVASSRPAVRFPVLFIVPRCFVLPGSLFLVSCSRLVRSSRQAVRILSFRPAARFGGSWCQGVFFVSFSSVLVVYRSLRFMDMAAGGSSFSSRGGVPLSLLLPVVESDWTDGCGGMNVPFSSARFFHQARAMAMMIWIRPQGRRTQ